MKKILLLFFAFTANAQAQDIQGETELAGFQLGQYRVAVHHQLGAPIQKKVTTDGWIYEFHSMKPDTSVYALFKYPQWDTTRVYSIQVNGERHDEMHPFLGFRLGEKKAKVDQILGAIDHTTRVEEPPLTIQYYKNKNYSVEIDASGNVFGIQIFGNIQRTKPIRETPSLLAFRNAVVTKNTDSLLTCLAPDIYIHHRGKIVTYKGAARQEFSRQDSDLVKHLLASEHSVWYAFAREMAEGSLHNQSDFEEGNDIIYYYQMYDSSIISEIVYVQHAGKWKVSDIKFR